MPSPPSPNDPSKPTQGAGSRRARGLRVKPIQFLVPEGLDGTEHRFGRERVGETRWKFPPHVPLTDETKELIHMIRIQDHLASQIRDLTTHKYSVTAAEKRAGVRERRFAKFVAGHELMTAATLAAIARGYSEHKFQIQHPESMLVWHDPGYAEEHALQVGELNAARFLQLEKQIADAATQRADRLGLPRVRHQIRRIADRTRGANPVVGFRTPDSSRFAVFLAGDHDAVTAELGSPYAPSGRLVLAVYRRAPDNTPLQVLVLDLIPMTRQIRPSRNMESASAESVWRRRFDSSSTTPHRSAGAFSSTSRTT